MGKAKPIKRPNIFPTCPAPCATHPRGPEATALVTHAVSLGRPCPAAGAKSQTPQKAKIEMKGSMREAHVHMHLSFERFVRTKEALSSLSKVL